MADDLVEKYSSLNMDEEEGGIIDVSDIVDTKSDEKLTILLVGRLLTLRPYNVDAFKRTMTKVWPPLAI